MNLDSIFPGGFVPKENSEEVQQSATLGEADAKHIAAMERYQATVKEEMRQAYIRSAMAYDESPTRYDPFDPERLQQLVVEAAYSQVLRRPVHSYKDALDIAYETCAVWSREDSGEVTDFDVAMALLAEEMDSLVAERERRRVAWRVAVQTRNKLLEEQDAIVKNAHQLYNEIRNDIDANSKKAAAMRKQRKVGPNL